jgi:hypothetical protein
LDLVAATDFDDDGKPYLVFDDRATSEVLIGPTGMDVVRSEQIATVRDPTWILVGVADLDQDGKLDLVFYNQATNCISVWFMTGTNGTCEASGS